MYPDMLVAGETAESRRARVIKGAGRSDDDLANLIVMFGRDAQPALVIGRHCVTELDSAPVQYNGIV